MNEQHDSTKIQIEKLLSDLTQKFVLLPEALKRNQEVYDKISSDLRSGLKAFEETLKSLAPFLTELKEAIKRNIEPFLEILPEIIERFQKLPDITRKTLVLLGQCGWYVSMDMPFAETLTLPNYLLEGDKHKIDAWMSEFYRIHLHQIKNDLLTRFSHRGKIIEAAFNAHQRGEYELSVPIFLAQADGICHDLIRIQLYRKIDRMPATAKFVDQLAGDSFTSALLEPLRVPMPIAASKEERHKFDIEINRHEILHGISVEYGTELNSLKAISLLHYISNVLDRYGDKKK